MLITVTRIFNSAIKYVHITFQSAKNKHKCACVNIFGTLNMDNLTIRVCLNNVCVMFSVCVSLYGDMRKP